MSILKRNINLVKHNLRPNTKLLMVAKANSYGAGLNVAMQLQDEIDFFGVARASEGVALRKLGANKQILILSYRDDECYLAREFNLTPCISSMESLKQLILLGIKSAHIAVDTGMSRLGLRNHEEFASLFNKGVAIEGVYSHIYHNSNSCLEAQRMKFQSYVNISKQFNPQCICHIASSGSYANETLQYNMVRIGMAIYHDSMRILSNIIMIKEILAGDDVGYNGEFVADKDMRIAVVEGGYADGIDKRFNRFSVTIGGNKCNIIGAISMDTFIVDISLVNCAVGDVVEIIGKGDIDNIVRASGVSEYEWLTTLKGRYEYGVDR